MVNGGGIELKEADRKKHALQWNSIHLRLKCQRRKKYFHFLCCRSGVQRQTFSIGVALLRTVVDCCCAPQNVIYSNKIALSHSLRHVIIIIILLLYYLNGVSISLLRKRATELYGMWLKKRNEVKKKNKYLSKSNITGAKKHIAIENVQILREHINANVGQTIERRARECHCQATSAICVCEYSPKCVLFCVFCVRKAISIRIA